MRDLFNLALEPSKQPLREVHPTGSKERNDEDLRNIMERMVIKLERGYIYKREGSEMQVVGSVTILDFICLDALRTTVRDVRNDFPICVDKTRISIEIVAP